MTLPSSMYRNPCDVVQSKEFFSYCCGACKHHQPKPDRSEYHCIAECKQWPDGTNSTCPSFAKRTKQRYKNARLAKEIDSTFKC